MGTPRYAAFLKEEHLWRLSSFRANLRAAGFSAAVLIAPEHLYYFGGYDSWVAVNSPQALILTAQDDAPTLVLRDIDLPLALETSWLDDIRTYSLVLDDYPSPVRDVIAEKCVLRGVIARELQSSAVPFQLGRSLSDAFAPAQVMDATREIGLLRLRNGVQLYPGGTYLLEEDDLPERGMRSCSNDEKIRFEQQDDVLVQM